LKKRINFYDEISLVQTDTTAGLLSQNAKKLAERKKRKEGHQFLEVTSSFKSLKKIVRVPQKFRNLVRRSKKRTFIYKNRAIRVINNKHKNFLEKTDFLYSTSANISGEKFNLEIAETLADNICSEIGGFSEKSSSQIIKLEKTKRSFLRK
jgi:tRNA A37 threonylcarbamoyladenosine synthetase subunit TsaC/SUA5/YrdC